MPAGMPSLIPRFFFCREVEQQRSIDVAGIAKTNAKVRVCP